MLLPALLAVPALFAPERPQEEAPVTVVAGPWQALGPLPFPSSGKPGRAGDIARKLKSMQPGSSWPALEESFEGVGKMTLPWLAIDPEPWLLEQDEAAANPRPRRGVDSAKLDLFQVLPLVKADPALGEQASAYLYRSVLVSGDLQLEVELRSKVTATLWCNGVQVTTRAADARTPSASGVLILRPGVNHLLLEALHDGEDDWDVELRERRPLDQETIDRAIDLGVDYLLARQALDGRWQPYGGYPQASTSIAVFTLLMSGVPRRHEAVLKGLEQLRREKAGYTYSASLQLMALVAGNDPQDRELILELSEDLMSWQLSNGLWAYGGRGDGPGPGGGDLSNTQYAALGLRAAVAAGVPVPGGVWQKMARGTLDCREGRRSNRGPTTGKDTGVPNGFGYSSGYPNAYPSMTAAGIGTLAIVRDNLPADGTRNLATTVARAIADGNAWLGANWSLSDLDRNFLGDERSMMWDYYYLYGLERAGELGGERSFGEHDWYQEGAALLLEQQGDNGGWGISPTPVTVCFALLFLKRASAQPPVTNIANEDERLRVSDPAEGPVQLRVTLRYPPAMWIDRQSERYEEFAQVLYWLRPPSGAWQRVPVSEGRNFALQPDLEQPGPWSVRADAILVDGSVLSSGTLDFVQEEGLTAERRAYIDEAQFNQIRGGSPQVKVSSAAPQTTGNFLVDGNPFSGWLAAEDDLEPTVDIKLRRSAKGSTLRLVPYLPSPKEPTDFPRATLVEVRINDAPAQTLRIPSDAKAKAILDLGKETSVRRIRLRILATEGTSEDAPSVGFSGVQVL
jgi:hypothetical protein